MLTNLAYAGGGTNTYGDAIPLTEGVSSADFTYTSPRYYIPSGANATTGTATPSTSTNGTGQYGYLYNWCAAMGGQSSACQSMTATQPDPTVSICPAGWRLPTGNHGGEFDLLNTAINNGSTTSSNGLLANGLFMYAGYWYNGSFLVQGTSGYYWSSTVYSANDARNFDFSSTSIYFGYVKDKRLGNAVRCVAP